MKLLAGFYVVCAFIDWLTFYMGRVALTRGDLICYDRNVVLVNSNLGALYMLFLSLVYYSYAMFMWFTFYQIPKKFGQVTRFTVDDVGFALGNESTMHILENEENLKTVVRELEHDRQFTKRQLTKIRLGSESTSK